MRLSADQARQRFVAVPVARLATASAGARPHIVPIVFVVAGDVLFTAVDAKPKRSTALRRLANIADNPQVCVLVDHYDDDWERLWWVRADGTARIAGGEEAQSAIRLLTERYPRYRAEPPPGPVITVDVASWTGWSAAD